MLTLDVDRAILAMECNVVLIESKNQSTMFEHHPNQSSSKPAFELRQHSVGPFNISFPL